MRQAESESNHPGVYILIFGLLLCVTALSLSILAVSSFSNQREYFCAELGDANSTTAALLQYKLDSHKFSYRTNIHGTLGVVVSFQILKWVSPDTFLPVLELCGDCAALETATCINEALPAGCQRLAAEIDVTDSTLIYMKRDPLSYSFRVELDSGVVLDSLSIGATCPFF